MIKDSLDRIMDVNAPAYLTLYTFRESIQRFFSIETLPLVQSQDVKREMRKGLDDPNANMQLYPFAYYSISTLSLIKDQSPIKGIARNSMGYTVDELTNATTKKAFVFPATINVELHYVTNDLIRALDFSTRALIVALSGKLNAEVQWEGIKWFVTVRCDADSVNFVRTDKEMESDPEAMDLTITFSIDTKLGAMRDVPKINNRGSVQQTIGNHNHDNRTK
jgi:hypothetical protein